MLSVTEQYDPNQNTPFPSDEAEIKKSFFRQLKSTISRCSILLLILGIVAQGGAFLFSQLFQSILDQGGTLPISLDMANFIIGYLPCLAADLIAIAIGLVLLKPNFQEGVFAKPHTDAKFIGLSFLGALGAGNIGAIIYTIYSSIITLLGGKFAVPEITAFSDPIAMTFLILYICILGPICEEIIFRGIILKSLERFGKMSAILISSILFALFHMNLVQLPGPFLIGLILGYITVESKSIYPAILIHILNNTFRGLPGLFITEEASLLNMLLTLLTLGLYAAGVIGIIAFLLKYGKNFTELGRWENLSRFSVSSKVLHLFMTVGSILYLLFYFFMLILSSIFAA